MSVSGDPMAFGVTGGANDPKVKLRPVKRGDIDAMIVRINSAIRGLPEIDGNLQGSYDFRRWVKIRDNLLRSKAILMGMKDGTPDDL